jgi:hypothetical protein
MKITRILLIIAVILVLGVIVFGIFTFSCESSVEGDDPEVSSVKDKSIQEYNIEQEKKISGKGTPCDTVALRKYVLDNYPAGTYLVGFDRTFTYSLAKEAVIYFDHSGKKYIYALIAKSKTGERFVDKNNLIGYESSFINLDSTKLGTAFFYLTLFTCENERFNYIWESEVPIHGGFNSMRLKKWGSNNTFYVELNFEAGIISGHRNFNYFMIDGIENPPHLLETYLGIVHKRVLTNVNNDKYPDYLEYRFIDDSLSIRELDSIPFYWSEKKQLYITDKSSRWFRKY